MTEITLNLTLDELKQIDKFVELNIETQTLFDKIRNAYPEPETLFDVIRNLGYSYDMCYEIVDAVEEFQKPKEPEDNEWKTVALGFGENLSAIGPCGYYDFTPVEWYEWVVDIYENTANEYLKLLEKERAKAKAQEPEKSPVEIAYKDWWGEYPGTEIWTRDDEMRWVSFSAGYYNAPSKVTEVEPFMTNCVLLGNPPDGYVTWYEWYNEMGAKGILYNLTISSKDYQPTPQERGDQIHKEVENEIEKLQEKNWYVDAKTLLKSKEPEVEEYLKPHTPEKTEKLLREAFQKVQQTEEWKETQRKIDAPKESWMDKPVEELVARLTNEEKELLGVK